MVKEFNILITGVGGQGVILMSELLGQTAVKDGLRVRGSEVLGMAVRGGPVVSMIRLGDEIEGPLIPMGKGDVLVAMEPAEGLRNITYLAKSGSIILNTQKIIPPTVSIGASKYPSLEQMIEKFTVLSSRLVKLDADQIAKKAGSLQMVNIVLLGALFGLEKLPLKIETMKSTIQSHFPEKTAPVNLKAFDLGYQACKQV
jgi:indolepyruvate ferredoxin oxidoreductase, beta subunit